MRRGRKSDRAPKSEYEKEGEGGATEGSKTTVPANNRYYLGHISLYKYNWRIL